MRLDGKMLILACVALESICGMDRHRSNNTEETARGILASPDVAASIQRAALADDAAARANVILAAPDDAIRAQLMAALANDAARANVILAAPDAAGSQTLMAAVRDADKIAVVLAAPTAYLAIMKALIPAAELPTVRAATIDQTSVAAFDAILAA